MKMKSESEVAQSCATVSDLMDCSLQVPPSMGFSRQEYWSGLPFSEQIRTKLYLLTVLVVSALWGYG